MQALRNKFHGKSKRRSMNEDLSNKKIIEERTETTTVTSTNLPTTTSTTTTTEVLSSNSNTNNDFMPTPPPMPSSDFFMTGKTYSWPEESYLGSMDDGLSFTTDRVVLPLVSTSSVEALPIEVIERPIVVHESIRREEIEEIQPMVHVEREKTEIRQITQPLTDKEIMPVVIEERMLPIEVLPTLTRDSMVAPEQLDTNTRSFEPTVRHVIEKAPIIEETESWRIIEEVTPIIYKETIIPHIIRTTRPVHEVIVESPIYSELVLSTREINSFERERYSHLFTKQFMEAPRSINIAYVPAPVAQSKLHKKEIIEEREVITTSTSVAPTLGGSGLAKDSSRSMLVPAAGPTILKEVHTDRVGPMGEKIHLDSITTSSSLMPTRAI